MTSEIFRNPTPTEQSSFLLQLYFGNEGSDLERCARRAYLDLCRTLRGISDSKYQHIYKIAESVVVNAIQALPEQALLLAHQKAFDEWHFEQCSNLKNVYKSGGFNDEIGITRFTYGHAQKWINMTLKYVYVFGESRQKGYEPFYKYCHIPIDNVIVDHLRTKYGISPTLAGRTWSGWDHYCKYLEFQQLIRNKFLGSSPLAVEFFLWQAQSKPDN